MQVRVDDEESCTRDASPGVKAEVEFNLMAMPVKIEKIKNRAVNRLSHRYTTS